MNLITSCYLVNKARHKWCAFFILGGRTVNIFQIPSDDIDYLFDHVGVNVHVNDIPTRAIITNTKVQTLADDRNITTLTPIKRGDLVDYLGDKWIIVSEVAGIRYGKYKGIMRQIEYDIKFNFNGDIKEFPTFVDSRVFDIQDDRYVTLPSGTILVTMQENDDTLGIKEKQRFIKMGKAWEVAGVDRTQKGLIILTAEITAFSESDNIEDEIADYYDYIDRYEITILDSEPIALVNAQTYQLNVEVKKNGFADESVPLTYISNDTSIATVGDNGLITAGSSGYGTIRVEKADDPSVFDSIGVSVENATIEIIGSDTIDADTSQVYSCVVKKDGVTISGAIGVWSLSDTSVGTLDQTVGDSVKFTAGSVNDTFDLIVEWQDNPKVRTRKTITIKNGSPW